IEELQKDLFEDRKRLASLSNEPIPERPGEVGDSRPLVFISYAHADRQWLERLLDYLEPLKRDAVLEIWDDTRIETGSRWREQIEAALEAARVAVLLVSADYLASDFVMDRELPFLLEAARDRGLHVLSVIVSPCRFERTPLRQFQAVNSPSSPLTSKSEREQNHILAIVAESVRSILMSPPRQLSTVQD
ncbi:MAG: toll/interleukin-1 receptor domain-containing protein, partial [Planctomycetota bacterium]